MLSEGAFLRAYACPSRTQAARGGMRSHVEGWGEYVMTDRSVE